MFGLFLILNALYYSDTIFNRSLNYVDLLCIFFLNTANTAGTVMVDSMGREPAGSGIRNISSGGRVTGLFYK